jgi:hypothetical protein
MYSPRDRGFGVVTQATAKLSATHRERATSCAANVILFPEPTRRCTVPSSPRGDSQGPPERGPFGVSSEVKRIRLHNVSALPLVPGEIPTYSSALTSRRMQPPAGDSQGRYTSLIAFPPAGRRRVPRRGVTGAPPLPRNRESEALKIRVRLVTAAEEIATQGAAKRDLTRQGDEQFWRVCAAIVAQLELPAIPAGRNTLPIHAYDRGKDMFPVSP